MPTNEEFHIFTVYRVLNAKLNYCDFTDLKQIAVKECVFRQSSIRKYVYTRYQELIREGASNCVERHLNLIN